MDSTIWDLLYRRSGNCMKRIEDTELLALQFDTPVLSPPMADFDEGIERVRKALKAEAVGEDGHPLPGWIRKWELIVRYQLERYLEFGMIGGERLYALEFQGSRQYVKFGYSKNLLVRVNNIQREAGQHGFALINGWASPGIEKAYALEQAALILGNDFFDQFPFHERFYGVAFPVAVAIGRAVFDVLGNPPVFARSTN
jgi:hypothetical protein